MCAQMAFLCAKVISPLRSLFTITATPPIARAIRRLREDKLHGKRRD